MPNYTKMNIDIKNIPLAFKILLDNVAGCKNDFHLFLRRYGFQHLDQNTKLLIKNKLLLYDFELKVQGH